MEFLGQQENLFSILLPYEGLTVSNGHLQTRSKKTEICGPCQLDGMYLIEITGNHTIPVAQTQSVTK